jgi:hypothetical protein
MRRMVSRYLARRRGRHTNSRIIPWEQVKTVALVISAEDKPVKHEVDKWCAASGKYVEVFYIDGKARKPSFADWHCLTAKEKNLLMNVRRPAAEKISKSLFDVVIDTTEGDDPFAANVCRSLRSGYKCSTFESVADTALKVGRKNIPLIEYLNEVVRYLSMIKPVVNNTVY